MHRLGMMVVAAIFPELIISAAWRQWRLSRWLCSEVNRLNIVADDNDSHVRPHLVDPSRAYG